MARSKAKSAPTMGPGDVDRVIGDVADAMGVKYPRGVDSAGVRFEREAARVSRDRDVQDRLLVRSRKPIGLVDDRAGSLVVLPPGVFDRQ